MSFLSWFDSPSRPRPRLC